MNKDNTLILKNSRFSNKFITNFSNNKIKPCKDNNALKDKESNILALKNYKKQTNNHNNSNNNETNNLKKKVNFYTINNSNTIKNIQNFNANLSQNKNTINTNINISNKKFKPSIKNIYNLYISKTKSNNKQQKSNKYTSYSNIYTSTKNNFFYNNKDLQKLKTIQSLKHKAYNSISNLKDIKSIVAHKSTNLKMPYLNTVESKDQESNINNITTTGYNTNLNTIDYNNNSLLPYNNICIQVNNISKKDAKSLSVSYLENNKKAIKNIENIENIKYFNINYNNNNKHFNDSNTKNNSIFNKSINFNRFKSINATNNYKRNVLNNKLKLDSIDTNACINKKNNCILSPSTNINNMYCITERMFSHKRKNPTMITIDKENTLDINEFNNKINNVNNTKLTINKLGEISENNFNNLNKFISVNKYNLKRNKTIDYNTYSNINKSSNLKLNSNINLDDLKNYIKNNLSFNGIKIFDNICIKNNEQNLSNEKINKNSKPILLNNKNKINNIKLKLKESNTVKFNSSIVKNKINKNSYNSNNVVINKNKSNNMLYNILFKQNSDVFNQNIDSSNNNSKIEKGNKLNQNIRNIMFNKSNSSVMSNKYILIKDKKYTKYKTETNKKLISLKEKNINNLITLKKRIKKQTFNSCENTCSSKSSFLDNKTENFINNENNKKYISYGSRINSNISTDNFIKNPCIKSTHNSIFNAKEYNTNKKCNNSIFLSCNLENNKECLFKSKINKKNKRHLSWFGRLNNTLLRKVYNIITNKSNEISHSNKINKNLIKRKKRSYISKLTNCNNLKSSSSNENLASSLTSEQSNINLNKDSIYKNCINESTTKSLNRKFLFNGISYSNKNKFKSKRMSKIACLSNSKVKLSVLNKSELVCKRSASLSIVFNYSSMFKFKTVDKINFFPIFNKIPSLIYNENFNNEINDCYLKDSKSSKIIKNKLYSNLFKSNSKNNLINLNINNDSNKKSNLIKRLKVSKTLRISVDNLNNNNNNNNINEISKNNTFKNLKRKAIKTCKSKNNNLLVSNIYNKSIQNSNKTKSSNKELNEAFNNYFGINSKENDIINKSDLLIENNDNIINNDDIDISKLNEDGKIELENLKKYSKNNDNFNTISNSQNCDSIRTTYNLNISKSLVNKNEYNNNNSNSNINYSNKKETILYKKNNELFNISNNFNYLFKEDKSLNNNNNNNNIELNKDFINNNFFKIKINNKKSKYINSIKKSKLNLLNKLKEDYIKKLNIALNKQTDFSKDKRNFIEEKKQLYLSAKDKFIELFKLKFQNEVLEPLIFEVNIKMFLANLQLSNSLLMQNQSRYYSNKYFQEENIEFKEDLVNVKSNNNSKYSTLIENFKINNSIMFNKKDNYLENNINLGVNKGKFYNKNNLSFVSNNSDIIESLNNSPFILNGNNSTYNNSNINNINIFNNIENKFFNSNFFKSCKDKYNLLNNNINTIDEDCKEDKSYLNNSFVNIKANMSNQFIKYKDNNVNTVYCRTNSVNLSNYKKLFSNKLNKKINTKEIKKKKIISYYNNTFSNKKENNNFCSINTKSKEFNLTKKFSGLTEFKQKKDLSLIKPFSFSEINQGHANTSRSINLYKNKNSNNIKPLQFKDNNLLNYLNCSNCLDVSPEGNIKYKRKFPTRFLTTLSNRIKYKKLSSKILHNRISYSNIAKNIKKSSKFQKLLSKLTFKKKKDIKSKLLISKSKEKSINQQNTTNNYSVYNLFKDKNKETLKNTTLNYYKILNNSNKSNISIKENYINEAINNQEQEIYYESSQSCNSKNSKAKSNTCFKYKLCKRRSYIDNVLDSVYINKHKCKTVKINKNLTETTINKNFIDLNYLKVMINQEREAKYLIDEVNFSDTQLLLKLGRKKSKKSVFIVNCSNNNNNNNKMIKKNKKNSKLVSYFSSGDDYDYSFTSNSDINTLANTSNIKNMQNNNTLKHNINSIFNRKRYINFINKIKEKNKYCKSPQHTNKDNNVSKLIIKASADKIADNKYSILKNNVSIYNRGKFKIDSNRNLNKLLSNINQKQSLKKSKSCILFKDNYLNIFNLNKNEICTNNSLFSFTRKSFTKLFDIKEGIYKLLDVNNFITISKRKMKSEKTCLLFKNDNKNKYVLKNEIKINNKLKSYINDKNTIKFKEFYNANDVKSYEQSYIDLIIHACKLDAEGIVKFLIHKRHDVNYYEVSSFINVY